MTLVNPIRIRVPCIAGPMPPVELLFSRKPRLSTGAPLTMTSQRMLIKGVTAIITQAAQRIKKRRFLNFLKA
jgi:hypothetical protein